MISIITITFNNFNQLQQTLSSIPQKNNIEVVVINGGSCEKTKEYLATCFNGVSLSEKDRGISDAFNKGVRLAKGDVIIFLNSGDVLVEASYIDFVEQAFTGDNDLVYTSCNIFFDDSRIGKYVPFFSVKRLENLAKGMPFPHPGLAVRREVFDKIGPFDLSLKIGMDFDFICRLSKLNPKGINYLAPVILMDGSGVSSTNHVATLRETIKILKKNDLYNLKARLSIVFRLLRMTIRVILPVGIHNFIKKKLNRTR